MGVNATHKIFSQPRIDSLKSFPFAVALRSMVAKPGVDEWRQVVNHTACVEDSIGPKNGRTSGSSLNERIKHEMRHDPNLEMTKGADLGFVVSVFHDAEFETIIVTNDANHYFHAFPSDNRTAFEQGTLTTMGPTISHVLDMGRTDSGLNTGQVSDLNATLVGEKIDTVIQSWISSGRVDPLIVQYRLMRESIYGTGSKQAWIAYPMQFSDDIVVVAIQMRGIHDLILDCVNFIGDMMGTKWEEDKYGSNIHIGYEFRHTSLVPTQHIKPSKVFEYTEKWSRFITSDFHTHTSRDEIAGQMNHASTIHINIKPLTKSVIKARHVKVSGMKQPMFKINIKVKDDIAEAVRILARNQGIPMMCTTFKPQHWQANVITQRGDACLNESDGYNGFGCWWFIPDQPQPRIVAIMDKWTEAEELILGRNIPAAEAITTLIGGRTLIELGGTESYDHYLTYTDSETTYVKFNSMKMGSNELDTIRDAWLSQNEALKPLATIDYTPREFNVLSDLLSKNKWEAFRQCILLMGLPKPEKLEIPLAARDWSDIHHAFV